MDVYYQKLGQGPAFFILHGLYGSSDNWVTFARQLSDNFTVYLVDQRNHGRSPHYAEHSYLAMSSDMDDIFVKEGIKKAWIMGHSMGGKTAMLFAARFPEKLLGLIVVDIAPVNYSKVDTYSSQSIIHLNIVNTLLAIDFSDIKSRVEIDDELEKTIKDISVRQFLMKNVHRNHNGTFIWKLNIDAISKALPGIINFVPLEKYNEGKGLENFPVLFIRGGKSDYILPAHFNEIKKYFPCAKIETIPNAGHWVHAEQPLRFMESVRSFLGIK